MGEIVAPNHETTQMRKEIKLEIKLDLCHHPLTVLNIID